MWGGIQGGGQFRKNLAEPFVSERASYEGREGCGFEQSTSMPRFSWNGGDKGIAENRYWRGWCRESGEGDPHPVSLPTRGREGVSVLLSLRAG